ncbi:hypothetical protein FRB93_012865 [Tulasnella sp. JGI-2019a]|nr:hypothetical protein FRB93_012865 [Tulasnella sp. JGI-2019a]
MGHLPHELTLEIIKELGQPPNRLAYRLPQSNIVTLGNLCRVCPDFRDLTEPILYSRIVITGANLEAFVRTMLPQTDPDEPNTPIHSASRKPGFVKSLAFIGFRAPSGAAEINHIVGILRVPKPALERLLIDVFVLTGRAIGPSSLHAAIREIPGLKEFASTIQDCDPTKVAENRTIALPPWPSGSSQTLRRIALNYPSSSSAAEMVGLLPNADSFVFNQPSLYFGSGGGRSMLHFELKAGSQSGREVIWVLTSRNLGRGMLGGFDSMVTSALRSGTGNASEVRMRMKMGVIEHCSPPGLPWSVTHSHDFFVEKLIDGTVWKAERAFDEYVKMIRNRDSKWQELSEVSRSL